MFTEDDIIQISVLQHACRIYSRTFTGARIETKMGQAQNQAAGSRTFTGAWIETKWQRYAVARLLSRTLCGD